MKMDKREKGFSLIELLIVITIILIIVAIALPNYHHVQMSGNETAAAGTLKTIMQDAVVYNNEYSNGYPPSLGALGGPAGSQKGTCDNAKLLDEVMSNNGSGNTATKNGYVYTYIPGPATGTNAQGCTNQGVVSYTVVAVPQVPGSTGRKGFYTDDSGAIRFTTDGTIPNESSPSIK